MGLSRELSRVAAVLEGLDQITRRSAGRWEAGPSARWLLPRAVGLTDLWSSGASAAAQPHYAH